MNLILIRHAESVANVERRWQGHADYPLTERGHAQAQSLAAALSGWPWPQAPVLYTSPLARTVSTAEAIAGALSISSCPWTDLREFDVGVFSGLTWSDIQARHAHLAEAFASTKDWNRVPGAERTEARAARARIVLETLREKHSPGTSVICVTHGGFMQYLLSAVLGTERVWGVKIGNTAIFDFVLQSYVPGEGEPAIDRFSTEPCRIRRFNDLHHLD